MSDMTPEEMKKELERLQAENETLKKRSEKELCLLFIHPRALNLISLRSAGTMPAVVEMD